MHGDEEQQGGEIPRGGRVKVYTQGETLLGLYRVEAPPIESGGMGRVYRVHHMGWNVDLAMKQPRAGRGMTEEEREGFLHESQAWINLGLHPNTVSCYYVRDVNGTLSIFSEWMDGGSLREWIADGRLYAGGQEQALRRILDIAIQTARGLKYAHANRLIHCDVKPANLLLTQTGDAKVADFGISKIRDSTKPAGTVSADTPISYTEEYCAPEQKLGGEPTVQTDIWSWAVTVLEMFLGERLWANGLAAGYGCDAYFDITRVYLPDDMADLLRQCFQREKDARPQDFGQIEQSLTLIYLCSTGDEYPRPEAVGASDTADSLNNRALSYLDMNMPEEAEAYWRKALLSSPAHAETLYNRALYRWRSGRYTDRQALNETRRAEGTRADLLEAMLQLERGDAAAADACIQRIGARVEDTNEAALLRAAAEQMMADDADGGLIAEESASGAGGFNRLCVDAAQRYVLGADYSHRLHLLNADTLERMDALPFDEKRDAVAATFSKDGRRFAAGSGDGRVLYFMGERNREFETLLLRVWDMDSKKCVMAVEGHTERVLAVGFSADSEKLLSAAKDSTVKTWDIESGACCGQYTVGDALTAAAFSSDGTHVLLGTENGDVRLLNMADGKSTLLKASENRIKFVSFCGGTKCIAVSEQAGMSLWDVRAKRQLLSMSAVRAEEAYLDPEERYIAARYGQRISIYHAETGRDLRTYDSGGGEYAAFCIKDAGKTLLAAQEDRLLAYSVPKFTYAAEYILCKVAPASAVLAAKKEFSQTARHVRDAVEKGEIGDALGLLKQLRKIPFFGESRESGEIGQQVRRYCVDDNVETVYAASVWYTKQSANARGFEAIAFLPDGNAVLCADALGDVQIAKTGESGLRAAFRYNRSSQRTNCVAISPDGKRFLAQRGSVFMQVDAETGKAVCEMRGHAGEVTGFAYSPDGHWALSGSEDATIRLWDASTGKLVRTFQEHTNAVNDVGFFPDGDSFFSCSMDGTIRIWRRTGAHSYRTMGQGALTAAACSPDGRYLVSGDRDGFIKLWDVTRGEMRWENAEHADRISCVRFHPDGKLIVSIDGSDEAMIWSAETGELLRTVQAPSGVFSMDVSPQGDSMALGCRGEIRMYRLGFALRFPGFQDWDEAARPYLTRFLAHRPDWSEEDFCALMAELQTHGYGWLRADGVRKTLEGMRRG